VKQPNLLHQQRPRIKKPKLLRSNPTRLSLFLNSNPNWIYIDDEDILSGYRIPNGPKRNRDIDHADDDLSDYVKFRLWLARQLALRKYVEKWG
jgi:hypothetical protein